MKYFINLTIVTLNDTFDVLEDAYIMVEGSDFKEVGCMSDIRLQEACDVIDCGGYICCPGFINAHTHLGLVALRSLADDMPDRLRKFLFPMETKYMDKDLVKIASEYAAYESLLNGTTTLADMYYYSEDVADVLDKVGIRALVGQTIIKDNQIDYKDEENALEAYKSLKKSLEGHHLLKPMIAPHGTTTVSESTLREIGKLSRESGVKVMMHVSEMDYEMEHFKPKTPIEAMDKLGLLDENFIAVHTIHTSDTDISLLKEKKASVISCTGANMKAGKGIPRLFEMMNQGVNVGLGTDGPISGNTLDLMSVMKLTAISQKTRYTSRDILSSQEILRMATRENAKILGFEKLGMIKEGYKADFLLISKNEANMYPIYDYHAALVYQLQPHNIKSVYVDGVLKVINGKLLSNRMQELRCELDTYISQIRKDTLYK